MVKTSCFSVLRMLQHNMLPQNVVMKIRNDQTLDTMLGIGKIWRKTCIQFPVPVTVSSAKFAICWFTFLLAFSASTSKVYVLSVVLLACLKALEASSRTTVPRTGLVSTILVPSMTDVKAVRAYAMRVETAPAQTVFVEKSIFHMPLTVDVKVLVVKRNQGIWMKTLMASKQACVAKL